MTLSYYGLPPQPVEAFNYFAGDGIKNALKRALAAAGDTDESHLEEGLPMCRAWMREDPCYNAEPYDGIVQALLEFARQHYAKCYIETFDNTIAAQKLYERNGFVRTDMRYGATGHYACNILYLKELRSRECEFAEEKDIQDRAGGQGPLVCIHEEKPARKQ